MSLVDAILHGQNLPDDVIAPMMKLLKKNARVPVLVADIAVMNTWLLDALGGDHRHHDVYLNAVEEIKDAAEDIVLIPITLNRAQLTESSEHWSLLVWFKKRGEWYHYDSINAARHGEAAYKLATAIHPNTTFYRPQMPKQMESDCGMYTLLYAVEIIDWLEPLNPEKCTPERLAQMRLRLTIMADDIDEENRSRKK